ncbi:DUF742 domain-containing protein [Streptomyces sp. NPDC006475]|uniref:DUF742 domain-containing protein n=1 Tax=Streptomyces sp. NPDC006475 TaxID=3155719 RepID=UPI0033B18B73
MSRAAGGNLEDEGPERLYVITGGRSITSTPVRLDLVTLIVARSRPKRGMPPEQAAIIQLCQSPLSVAEVSAYTRLPISVITVLLGDLVADNWVITRAPVPPVALPDRALLEAVIHGLQRL